MTEELKDAAQALAEAMAAVQERLRHLDSASPADAEPVPDALQMLKGYSELQQNFANEVANFWSGMTGFALPGTAAPSVKAEDKRLTGEAWESSPWADAVKRAYLSYAAILDRSVDGVALEEGTKKQVRFGLRQFTDAVSPANFLLTNPEALELARESNGQSLVEGLRLFFQDLAKGQVSTTDENAFEVGRNVATTPGR